MFVASGLDLTESMFRPDKLRHKAAAALGSDDIDFADSPHLSRTYLLRRLSQMRTGKSWES